MTDQDILARTLYGEARGEGIQGISAVANVIMNRFVLWQKHPHFGKGTIASTCQAPWQFSCWNEDDPNRKKLLTVTNMDQVFAQCLSMAQRAINNTLPDITGGATYYFVKDSPEPAWAVDETPCAIIGRHLFYKDIA